MTDLRQIPPRSPRALNTLLVGGASRLDAELRAV